MAGKKTAAVFGFAAAAYLSARHLAARRRRFKLRGATAVVTGGSRGLGLVLARELAAAGAKLALLARSGDDLEEARRDLEEFGAEGVLTIECDVGDRASVESAIERVLERFGRIDVLINNAGLIQVGPLEHMTVEDFEEAMRVHFWGPLYAMRAAIPAMRRQGGGRIANISSIGGKVAVPHLAPYCASKFALTGLSDAFRAELARDQIYVTTVCPGLMRTGSHVNVGVKGRHKGEFTWFALGAGAPLLSMNARRAARSIVRAVRQGAREIDVGIPARVLTVSAAVAPAFTGEAMAQINRVLLPDPAATDDGESTRSGWESHSSWAPSRFTRRADRAAEENNELRGHAADDLYR